MAKTADESEAVMKHGQPRRFTLRLSDLPPGAAFLVETLDRQHGFALDSVEFPFDTCVIQIEAFGQAGQHVLTCFGVHYGKFQGRATAVKDQYQLAHVLHLPVLRLYADSVESSSDGWDSPAGGLWSQEGASNFSNRWAQTVRLARASNQRFATGLCWPNHSGLQAPVATQAPVSSDW